MTVLGEKGSKEVGKMRLFHRVMCVPVEEIGVK